jgi:hypothetical protein
MEIALDVAFVVAAVGFFKTQFALKGPAALGCAFVVSALVEVAPSLAALVPAAAPFITGLVSVVALFIAAAGSFDTVKELVKLAKP